MDHTILNIDSKLSLIQRLLKIRGVDDDIETFLHPKLWDYRGNPFDLHDMDKGTDIIIEAMKKKKSICIFGDYDVDGITSSYIIHYVLSKHFNHKKVKIMFPDRLKDGYGLKVYHLDVIKKVWHDLVITVDNGIASIEEAAYAKKIWLQLIITDHHKAHDILPQADAVINPQISKDYIFKWLCWAWVAYKVVNALLKKSTLSSKKQTKIMNELLPIVAIATVADCVPLVGENRAIVKRWLKQMTRRDNMLPSLDGLLDFVNINGPLKSYHIWFVIGPRINAWGRLATWYDSIKILLYDGGQQIKALEGLDIINDERKKLQKKAFDDSLKQIDPEHNVLIVADATFHQWVVGIVAWKLTEKYNKPAIILTIDEERWLATGSLRWPDYFDVMDMMQRIQAQSIQRKESEYGILLRFWWHKQAGWVTMNYSDLELFRSLSLEYTTTITQDKDIKKIVKIDTILTSKDRDYEILDNIEELEPFWIANQEPTFILHNTIINTIEIVWKKWNGHLKLNIQHGDKKIEVLYRSKGIRKDEFVVWSTCDIIGKIKYDNYKKLYYIDGILWDPL